MTGYFGGFGIQGYRSFYSEMQFIGKLGKINLLAGKNNAGKSNVIRFLRDHLHKGNNWTPSELDIPQGVGRGADFAYAICIPPFEELHERFRTGSQHDISLVKSLLDAPALKSPNESDGVWIRFTSQVVRPGRVVIELNRDQAENVNRQVGAREIQLLSQMLTGTVVGNHLEDCLRVLNALKDSFRAPKVEVIDAFRRIEVSPDSTTFSYAGTGLIEQLSRLQNPNAHERDQMQPKFNSLNRFVSEVFERDNVILQVPHGRDTINISFDDDIFLPLDHHGTGIHQIIILATAATFLEGCVVCIEEPEVNLHPILQRRFLNYLHENTSNQYIITTHSANMLDYEKAKVLHLEYGETGTLVTPATSPAQVSRICGDLGYRPSDLLQTNAIIWVEGPSDRTYVKHWIAKYDPSLVEDIHYSIMFYGGSLLSEVSADDSPLTEFINLRRLNRHICVIIDSDKKSQNSRLNSNKLRVRREFEESSENGFAWITHGYTIENYIPRDLLIAAVKKVHPKKNFTIPEGDFKNPFESVEKPTKTRIAAEVVSLWDDPLQDSRLRRMVVKLVKFIYTANGRIKNTS